MIITRSKKQRCAFISSNFGFGPVSKAATIAEEVKRCLPQTELDFFGSGIALQFARQSKVFDRLIETDVENPKQIRSVLPKLKKYEKIFSIMNLFILEQWHESFGKLFFVDSLAWMWNKPPAGIENAEIYFVQDYLVSPNCLEEWEKSHRVILIPPIILTSTATGSVKPDNTRCDRLLVNFSGCYNNFVKPEIYEKYARTLLFLIFEEAKAEFEEIEVCVNEALAEKLKKSFFSSSLKINQLPHKKFLRKLADSKFLLTSPGITTTLEAITSGIRLGFLLPQNDSQAVMSEVYRSQIDESLTMAFSRFDKNLAFPISFEAFKNIEQPVALAAKIMNTILDTYPEKIRKFIAVMLKSSSREVHHKLNNNIRKHWTKKGQTIIVEKVFDLY